MIAPAEGARSDIADSIRTGALGGGLQFVATPILPGSLAVRMHRQGEHAYFANIIASPLSDGRELYLSSHLSTQGTLSHRQWLAAAAELYPHLTAVLFERLGSDGKFTDHRLNLQDETCSRRVMRALP